MKKVFPFLAIAAIVFSSFVPAATVTNTPSFCENLLAVMKEEPTEFKSLKGAYIETNGNGSKDYQLKNIKFDGWDQNEYAIGTDGAISVDISYNASSKADARKFFDAADKKIKECLEVDPINPKAEVIEILHIYTHSKNDVGLMMIEASGKWTVMMSISRES